MNSDQYTDLCELYALGALDAQERAEFESHLAQGCAECSAGLAKAVELNEMIISATPRVQPNPRLRRRVLAAFADSKKERSFNFGWIFATATAAALIVFLAGAWNSEREARLASTAELARLREIQQILQSPDTKEVNFGPQPAVPHGSVFVHKKLGMILIASNLPTPPEGWTYESWVVPKEGPPVPVEPFRAPDGRGLSLLRSTLPVGELKAVAVSLEPTNAPVVKPTKLVFAAALGS